METNPTIKFLEELQSGIAKVLKNLLQEKHLYQYEDLDINKFLVKAFSKIPTGDQTSFYLSAIEAFNDSWIGMASLDQLILHPTVATYRNPTVEFRVPDIKIYCRECKRVEAFNAQYCKECYPEDITLKKSKDNLTVQIFALSFLCQSCKKVPEFFMVRREGHKLTLSGRSPIEHVVVPKVIPNDYSKFYSDAIVAHHSGQTLAGLFLLRTFIEQWVRSKEPGHEHVDQELASYGKSLPEDFRARFPSLEDLYSKLSASIHKADPSEEVFQEALLAMNKHFEARKLYDL